MGHFGRLFRRALKYPLTTLSVIVSSLLVAVLWGGNISTVYPLVEVAFNGQSMRQWVDTKISTTETTIKELEKRVEAEGRTERLSERIKAETKAQQRYRSIQPLVQRMTPASALGTLAFIVSIVLVGTLLKNLFLGANLVLVERLAQSVTLELRRKFFHRTLKLDLGTLGEDHSSDLMARFTHDMNGVATALNSLYGRSVREPLKMLACLIGASFICWRLLLLSLLAAPLAAVFIGLLARSIKRANRRAMEEMNRMYGVLSEVIGGIDVVKAYTMEQHECRRFEDTSQRYMSRLMKIMTYNALLRPTTELMGMGTICVAILAGGYLVLNQQTELLGITIATRPLDRGALMTFFALLIGASDPARKLADVYGVIQRGVAACDRIFDRLNRESKIVERTNPVPLPRPLSDIEFHQVNFGYQPDRPVLQAIDLTVKRGQTIAIVGPNGCGKSTLMNLIPRFYEPDSGKITVSSVDLRDVALLELRRSIALVSQRTVLFDDTILENMRYGTPDASLDEVIEAARQAHIHEFVSQLPDGYETSIGEAGNRLSGGQRQRIALARAILRKPEILLLDEATSQIDPESERAIHETLRSFVQDRTTIMVTHRLTTLSLADQIVVLNHGRVLDIGTAKQLGQRCELFRRLFPNQMTIPASTPDPNRRHSA